MPSVQIGSIDDPLVRREYKYLLTQAMAQRVQAELVPFCSTDANAQGTRDGAYLVDSVYLDSPDYAFFWATVRQHSQRTKLRVRFYPHDPSGPIYGEVKDRIGDVISKQRVQVSRTDWIQLLKPGQSPKDPQGSKFWFLCQRLSLRPAAWVRYRRKAFMSMVDTYARVTFDTRIEGMFLDGGYALPNPPVWRSLDPRESLGYSPVVMELKFLQDVPR